MGKIGNLKSQNLEGSSLVALSYHLLLLATTELLNGIISNLKFEAYFEVFCLSWEQDSLSTLKAHHSLPFIASDSPSNHLVSG